MNIDDFIYIDLTADIGVSLGQVDNYPIVGFHTTGRLGLLYISMSLTHTVNLLTQIKCNGESVMAFDCLSQQYFTF